MPRIPSADSTGNILERDVIGNKSDAAVESVGTTASLMAYLKGLVNNAVPGSVFVVAKTINQNAIVAAGVDLTGVSSGGALLVEDVIVQTATAFDSTSDDGVLNLAANNVLGSAAFMTAAQAKLGANMRVDFKNATSAFKAVIETGKKITASATVHDFSASGNVTFYFILRRLAAGATIAAA